MGCEEQGSHSKCKAYVRSEFTNNIYHHIKWAKTFLSQASPAQAACPSPHPGFIERMGIWQCDTCGMPLDKCGTRPPAQADAQGVDQALEDIFDLCSIAQIVEDKPKLHAGYMAIAKIVKRLRTSLGHGGGK